MFHQLIGTVRAEDMVVKEDNPRDGLYHVNGVEKGGAMLEATRYKRFVQNI